MSRLLWIVLDCSRFVPDCFRGEDRELSQGAMNVVIFFVKCPLQRT